MSFFKSYSILREATIIVCRIMKVNSPEIKASPIKVHARIIRPALGATLSWIPSGPSTEFIFLCIEGGIDNIYGPSHYFRIEHLKHVSHRNKNRPCKQHISVAP